MTSPRSDDDPRTVLAKLISDLTSGWLGPDEIHRAASVIGDKLFTKEASANTDGPWMIEWFNSDVDHPDWESGWTFFRSKEAADRYVDQENARQLDLINKNRARYWKERRTRFLEEQALISAGLRIGSIESDPGPEFTPVTELGRWDTRYRVVPIEFND